MAWNKDLKPKETITPNEVTKQFRNQTLSHYQEYIKMSESQFNPDEFFDSTTTEALTRRPPIPAGDYIATIGDKFTIKSGTSDKTQRDWTAMNIPLEIDLDGYPEAKAKANVDKVTLFHFVSLDLVPGTKNVDYGPGKNRGMRQYREATNLNIPGNPFSPRMLVGRQVKVKVVHEDYQGEIQERVNAISGLQ